MLINLQVPLYSITGQCMVSEYARFVGGRFAGLRVDVPAHKAPRTGSELLALGTIAVIGLMPVYHRFYDAALLAIPLCWCMSSQRTGKLKNVAWIALLLMVPFLAPGTALLQQLAATRPRSRPWTHSWWWDRVVMPHETWTLLLLCLVLLYGIKLGLVKPCQRQIEVKSTAENVAKVVEIGKQSDLKLIRWLSIPRWSAPRLPLNRPRSRAKW